MGSQKILYSSERRCLQCEGKVERVGRELRRYCSEKCRKERKRLIRSGAVKRTCEWCGNSLKGMPSATRFCVGDCREKSDAHYRAQYYADNHETICEKRREYMAKRKLERPEFVREKNRKWWNRHRDKLNSNRRTPEYRARTNVRANEKYRNDPRARVRIRMRARIYDALRSKKAGRKWETLVGYTLPDLMVHLERQFSEGMSWENMGDWHIDHIIPISSFNVTDEGCEDFKACWSLTNLRPLWASDNQRKHAKRELLL